MLAIRELIAVFVQQSSAGTSAARESGILFPLSLSRAHGFRVENQFLRARLLLSRQKRQARLALLRLSAFREFPVVFVRVVKRRRSERTKERAGREGKRGVHATRLLHRKVQVPAD